MKSTTTATTTETGPRWAWITPGFHKLPPEDSARINDDLAAWHKFCDDCANDAQSEDDARAVFRSNLNAAKGGDAEALEFVRKFGSAEAYWRICEAESSFKHARFHQQNGHRFGEHRAMLERLKALTSDELAGYLAAREKGLHGRLGLPLPEDGVVRLLKSALAELDKLLEFDAEGKYEWISNHSQYLKEVAE